MFHYLAPRTSGSSDDSSSNVVPLAVGLGVGVPCAATVVILVWLYFRSRRVSREEDERHENIDIDGDVTLYENHIGIADEKYAIRPKVHRDNSSSFMYTPYFKESSMQSVDGYSRSMTSVLGPSPFHQSSEMLRTPRSYSASSMQWQAPRLPTQPWSDQGSAHNSYTSTHTLSSVPSSPGGLESLASESDDEGDLSYDATHRESMALEDPDFRGVSSVSRNKTPPLTTSAQSVRLSVGHRATFGYEGDGSDDPRLSTVSFASLHTARSNALKTQFSDSKTSLAHSALANEILPDDSEINDSNEYTGESYDNSAVSDVQVGHAQIAAGSDAVFKSGHGVIAEPAERGPEEAVREHAGPEYAVQEHTASDAREQYEPEDLALRPEPVGAPLENSVSEHVPQRTESGHVPQHTEFGHMPQHTEPEHVLEHTEPEPVPQHTEPEHDVPQNTGPGPAHKAADSIPEKNTQRNTSDFDFGQLPSPETTPAPSNEPEPVATMVSTPHLGPTPESSYDMSLDSPWGTNNHFLPQRPPSPATSSAPSSVYPESSISNQFGFSQPSSPQVGNKSPGPVFVPTLSDYMDLPDVPSSGGFKPHAAGRKSYSSQRNARPPVPAPRNSIAVLDESVFIQPKRKFGPKSRGKSLPPQHAGQGNYGPP